MRDLELKRSSWTKGDLLAWGAVAMGIALRWTDLGRQSLWLDEMTSIQVARCDLQSIVTGQVFDNFTPPLYYVLLYFWGKIFELDEVGLRSLSALIDCLNIALLWLLCRRIVPQERNRQLVVAAYALSPFMLYYAQEGRMYTLAVFWSLALALLIEKLTREDRPRVKWALATGAVLALGVYTHYYFAFYALGLYIVGGWVRRFSPRHLAGLALSGVTGILLFSPWIPIVFQLTGSGGQTFREFNFLVLPYALFRFIAGYGIFPLNLGTKVEHQQEIVRNLPALLPAFAALIILSWNAISQSDSDRRKFLKTVGVIVGLPPLIGFILSIKIPMLSERYLILIYPFFLLMISGFPGPANRSRIFGLSILFLVMIMGNLAYFSNPDFGKSQWREAAQFVRNHVNANDEVVVEPPYLQAVFKFYFNKDIPVKKEYIQSQTKRLILVSEGRFAKEKNNYYANNGFLLEEELALPFENGIICTIWKK